MLKPLALAAGLALGAAAAAPPPTLPPLPGWRSVAAQTTAQPGGGLPAAEAAVMREFGLRTVEQLQLARPGHRLAVEALHFGDAGGAIGGFTWERGAAKAGAATWIPMGSWLLRVQSDLPADAMRRALAPWIATLGGGVNEATDLPAVVSYLPRKGRRDGSVRYVEGPVAFAAACAWLPADQVGFDHSAEAAVADYDPAPAQMVVISYPTPQMARTRLPALARLPGVAARRSGPLVVLVHGADAVMAQALLPAVHYDADFTLTPPVPVGMDALPGLLLGVFMLCGLIMAVALVVGVMTGLARRLVPARYRRLAPESLIQLHLRH